MSGHRTIRPIRDERGIALLTVVLVGIVVTGLILVIGLAAATERSENRLESSRESAAAWIDSAGQDIAIRLERGELGRTRRDLTIAGVSRRVLIAGNPGTSVGYGSGTCAHAYPLDDGDDQHGFYCLLPIATGVPETGALLNLDPADPNRGTIITRIRVWDEALDDRPIDVELRLGRSALTRYAILSDDPINIESGTVLPNDTVVHSNNVSNASVGIDVAAGVTISPRAKLSATRSASGRAVADPTNCSVTAPDRCFTTGENVDFNAVDSTLDFLLHNSDCTGFVQICHVDPSDTQNIAWKKWADQGRYPVQLVQLNPVAPNQNCVRLYTFPYAIRQDQLDYPMIDDRYAPSWQDTGRLICPPPNGGGIALIFDTDVQIHGRRPPGAPPITLYARRSHDLLDQYVRMPDGHRGRITDGANIYIDTDTHNGYRDPGAPAGINIAGGYDRSAVGLVAEAGVLLPTYLLDDGHVGNMQIQSTAFFAAGTSFGVAPSFRAQLGDSLGAPGTGAGAGVCEGTANQTLAHASRILISGTVASRERPVLGVRSGGCSAGYTQRTFDFDERLAWDPPPFYPATSPWQVVEMRRFTS